MTIPETADAGALQGAATNVTKLPKATKPARSGIARPIGAATVNL